MLCSPTMPHYSEKQAFLQMIYTASQTAQQLQQANLEQQLKEEADFTDTSISFDDGLPGLILSSISPISPMIVIPDFLFDSIESDDSDLDDSNSSLDSDNSSVSPVSHYDHFIDAIAALEEEVLQAHVLYRSSAPPLHALQVHVPAQCEDCPKAFHKKIQVDPDIFDDILDQIINHPIFHSQPPVNFQLPVAVQLAIFLN